jgi:hypothetical protein
MESIIKNNTNIFMFIHLITSLIFIKLLKERNPYLLTFLLLIIVSYIAYETNKFIFIGYGIGLYIIDKIINDKKNDIECNKKNNLNNFDYWKIFFYSIIVYYLNMFNTNGDLLKNI